LEITGFSNDDISNSVIGKITSTSEGIEWSYTGEFNFAEE
jgi:hypothetical protein